MIYNIITKKNINIIFDIILNKLGDYMEKFEKIELNREYQEHLYIQLYKNIKELIENNILKKNEKLPPIRKLAKLLDVNNVTIVKSYDLLENEKYVYKKVGSGTFVNPNKVNNQIENTYISNNEELEIHEDLELMDRGQIEIRKNMINFASATPTPELFPVEDFKEVLNMVLDRDKGLAFGYQASKGYYPLIESIVKYLKVYGIETSTKNIQIISGAQQGIDIIAKALLEHGDTVIVESPTYTGAIATFKSRGVRIIDVPIQKDGIDIGMLEDAVKKYKPKLIYTMPNFQNPTGYSYSHKRKEEVLKLADKYKLLIIEDDYLSDLNFYGNYGDYSRTLKSIDENDKVIYIKSFSKIFMPGLRLGFLTVPLRLNNEILVAKHASDISTSGLIQRTFDLYLRKGIWQKHIEFMRNVYKERFDIMMESLKKYMPDEIIINDSKGGINFWVGFPDNFSINELYTESVNNNIAFVPGGVFYASERDSNYIRLSIASVYPEDIRTGIKKLSRMIKFQLKKDNNTEANVKSYRPIL